MMRHFWRRGANAVGLGLCAAATVIVLAPLALVLYYVLRQGLGALSWQFLTRLPAPPGQSGGGMGNAILGTVEMLAIAMLLGLPLGLAAAIYCVERGRERLAPLVRFAADALTGIPTIVTGLFVYLLLVVPMHRFSGLAGAVALALVLLPVMMRASEEALQALPPSYREGALALGATPAQAWRRVLLPAARSGLVGAALTAVARTAGETAPLLLTALNNTHWNLRPDQPMASLTVQIFDYAISPYDGWHRQAWAAALTLIVLIVSLSLCARWWGSRQEVA